MMEGRDGTRRFRLDADSDVGDGGVDLRELWRIAQRGRLWIALCGSISIVLAIAYLFVAQPIFQVSAKLLIDRRGAFTEADERFSAGTNFLATQTEVVHSPAIVAGAVRAVPEAVPVDAEGDPVRRVLESLSVARVAGTNVLALGYQHGDPEVAVRFLKAVIDGYREYLREDERDGSTTALDVLSQNERELRSDLAGLEKRYRALRVKNASIGGGNDAFAIQREMLKTQGEKLIEARRQRIDLENQLDASFRASSNDPAGSRPDPSGSGDPAAAPGPRPAKAGGTEDELPRLAADVGDLREALWQAQARRAELLQAYGAWYPEVRQVEARIATLKDSLVQNLTAGVEAAKRTEGRLEAIYEREVEKARKLDGSLLEEQTVRDEMERVRTLHQATLVQLNDLELNVDAQATGRARVAIRVLDPPVPPEERLWPKPVLVLLPGAVAGLLGGLGLAWIRDLARPKTVAGGGDRQPAALVEAEA